MPPPQVAPHTPRAPRRLTSLPFLLHFPSLWVVRASTLVAAALPTSCTAVAASFPPPINCLTSLSAASAGRRLSYRRPASADVNIKIKISIIVIICCHLICLAVKAITTLRRPLREGAKLPASVDDMYHPLTVTKKPRITCLGTRTTMQTHFYVNISLLCLLCHYPNVFKNLNLPDNRKFLLHIGQMTYFTRTCTQTLN